MKSFVIKFASRWCCSLIIVVATLWLVGCDYQPPAGQIIYQPVKGKPQVLTWQGSIPNYYTAKE